MLLPPGPRHPPPLPHIAPQPRFFNNGCRLRNFLALGVYSFLYAARGLFHNVVKVRHKCVLHCKDTNSSIVYKIVGSRHLLNVPYIL